MAALERCAVDRSASGGATKSPALGELPQGNRKEIEKVYLKS